MWHSDDKIEKVVALLDERLPGSSYDMEDLVEDSDDLDALVKEASNPWYALVETGGMCDLFGRTTKDALVDYLMAEYHPSDVEDIEIYHDGIKTKWRLTIEITE